jgi:hypothetical protein
VQVHTQTAHGEIIEQAFLLYFLSLGASKKLTPIANPLSNFLGQTHKGGYKVGEVFFQGNILRIAEFGPSSHPDRNFHEKLISMPIQLFRRLTMCGFLLPLHILHCKSSQKSPPVHGRAFLVYEYSD